MFLGRGVAVEVSPAEEQTRGDGDGEAGRGNEDHEMVDGQAADNLFPNEMWFRSRTGDIVGAAEAQVPDLEHGKVEGVCHGGRVRA